MIWLLLYGSSVLAESVGPLQKVIQLLGGLQEKVIDEGQSEQANFEEFSTWCQKQNTEKTNSIKAMQQEILGLKSTIDSASANVEQLSASIGKLASQISTNEKELAASVGQRDEERKLFTTRDIDLGETIDMLTRARNVLKKSLDQAQKHGKMSLIQSSTESMKIVAATFQHLVSASFVDVQYREKIMSYVQTNSESETDAWTLIPQASQQAYDSQSGGILKIMEDLQDKAEEFRNVLQREEMETQHNFAMFKQSTEAELKAFQAQLDDSKKKRSRAEEVKATAEGDLKNVQKDLAADEQTLADVHSECMSRATEFGNSQQARADELKVLAEAKTILINGPGQALVQKPKPPKPVEEPALSFLQVRSPETDELTYTRQMEAANYLKHEGMRLKSWVLAQVGHKVQGDAFTKVKKMIQTMVEKLMEAQASEAEHKQWCDQETSKSKKAKEKKTDKVEDIQTKIDQASSLMEQRDRQIQVLLRELAEMDTAQDESVALRQKEHASFVIAEKDLSAGQLAVASAMKLLLNYYRGGSFVQVQQKERGKQQPDGPAAGIIGLLEVAESDFSSSLAEAMAREEEAQQEFDTQSQDYRVSKAAKTQDVNNKTAEKERLANLVQETKVDVRDAQAELNAVVEYLEKLKGDCETKAPAFEERQERRKREMEGLQNALSILEGRGVALLDVSAQWSKREQNVLAPGA